MNLQGKKVVIIGAARSGLAAARLADQLGARVRISEKGGPEKIPEDFRRWAEGHQVLFECHGHTRPFVTDADLVVISPGVRFDAEPLAWAREKGLTVWGEIEFAFRFCRKPVIAVTGSNGKTTTVNLITDILSAAGLRPRLCGNVGMPFSDFVMDMEEVDYVILEVSSFQMETIEIFRPYIAVLLNFSQNHLDRHKDLEEYFNAKTRIFEKQGGTDYSILNAQDQKLRSLATRLKSRILFFNTEEQKVRTGITNPNYLAAAVVAEVLDIDERVWTEVFANFKGVEHRLEKVRVLAGVEYVNDSKATTAEAGRWALERIDRPIILLCGGRDKNIDFSVLRELVTGKVKKMLTFGEARQKLSGVFRDIIPVEECFRLDDAVLRARELATEGDCVLLSPMCTSFDAFANFEERGRYFKSLVNNLRP